MSDLSSYSLSLNRRPAAGHGLDHPRLHRRFLLQDSLLFAEGSDGISCDLERLQPVVSHDAGPQCNFVEYVPAFFRPVFKEFDRVEHCADFSDQVLSVLQVDGLLEASGIHISLSFDKRFQWLSRPFTAACFDLMSPADSFKTAWIAMREKSRRLTPQPQWRSLK